MHLDELSNSPLVEIAIKTNLVDFGLEDKDINIPKTGGVHDLYIKFSNDGEKPVTALISLYFSNKAFGEST